MSKTRDATTVVVRWVGSPPDGTVTVNQLPAWPRVGESSWEAALRQVARIAERDGRNVRAVLIDENGEEKILLLSEVVDSGADQGLSLAETWSNREGLSARPESGASTAAIVGSSAPSLLVSSGSLSRAERRRRRSRWDKSVLSVVIAGALVTVAAASVAIRLMGGGGVAPSENEISTTPLGYDSNVRWSTPELDREAGPVVPVGAHVAFVTANREIRLVDSATGSTTWSSRVPEGTIQGGLKLLKVTGRESFVTHVGNRLLWWDVKTGLSGEVAAPNKSELWTHGGEVMLNGPDGAAYVLHKGKLLSVKIPPGMTAFSARKDGSVLAVASKGWLLIRPDGQKSKVTPFESPDGEGKLNRAPAVAGALAYAGGQLVTLWPEKTGGTLRLAVYSETQNGMPLAFTAPLPLKTSNKPLEVKWRPSPSEYWGVLSSGIIVDVAGAAVRDMGDTDLSRIYYDRATGVFNKQLVVAGPNIPLGRMDPRERVPEVVTNQGAFVRDSAEATVSMHPPKVNGEGQ